jgi:hypothetical protein
MIQFVHFLVGMSLAGTALAHPGEDIHKELMKKQQHLNDPERINMDSCTRVLEENGHYKRELSNRSNRIDTLRVDRGFQSC